MPTLPRGNQELRPISKAENFLALSVYTCKLTAPMNDWSISEAELKVMELLWTSAPQTGPAIIETLSVQEEWHPSTIKTLIGRLCRKGVIHVKPGSKPFLYSPGINRDEFLKQQSENFLQRFFGGSIEPFLVHFANKEKLSSEDFRELRRILGRKKR